jgi:hypothetical protein
VLFSSESLSLDLRFVVDASIDDVPLPDVELELLDLTSNGHKGSSSSLTETSTVPISLVLSGLSAVTTLKLTEGQSVTFILRHSDPKDKEGRIKLAQVAEKVRHWIRRPKGGKYRAHLECRSKQKSVKR